ICAGRVVRNTSTKTCPVQTAPDLAVTKDCPTTPITAGSQVVYSGFLTNSGNVTLTDVVVNSGANRVIGPLTLAPGQVTNFTGSVTAPANTCSLTDVWTVTARDRCTSATLTRSATTTCPVGTTPKIDITVACPATPITPGTLAHYTGSLRNYGDITLTKLPVL